MAFERGRTALPGVRYPVPVTTGVRNNESPKNNGADGQQKEVGTMIRDYHIVARVNLTTGLSSFALVPSSSPHKNPECRTLLQLPAFHGQFPGAHCALPFF
jgi:hypothetical protein